MVSMLPLWVTALPVMVTSPVTRELGPMIDVTPCGRVKFRMAADEVPLLVTEALGPVVVVPIDIVAAAPAVPGAPDVPAGPMLPAAASSDHAGLEPDEFVSGSNAELLLLAM
jgi:hypothetical protein